MNNRLIHLNPSGREQTKKRRPTLPITNTLFPWLQNTKADVLVSWRGKPLNSIKKGFRRLRERAGLDTEVVPYTVRHTMATELRKRAVPAWEVAGFLGHKSEGITERYAKYAPDYLGQAVQAIDQFFVELQPLLKQSLVFKEGLRVSCVLEPGKRRRGSSIKLLKTLVGVSGFEPPAPASRIQSFSRNYF
jgi:hypothetical protein